MAPRLLVPSHAVRPARTVFALLLLAASGSLGGSSCTTAVERLPADFDVVTISPSSAAFAPGSEVLAGSTVSGERPLEIVYTAGRDLPPGSIVVVEFPVASQEEAASLWSAPSAAGGAPGGVEVLAPESARLVEAERATGGAGRIAVRLDDGARPGDEVRVGLTGQAPRIVRGEPFRVFEIDGASRTAAALAPERCPVSPIVPGPAEVVVLSLPADGIAGEPFALRAVALDRFGNVATRFTGEVAFAKGPDGLPPARRFSATDEGRFEIGGLTARGDGFVRIAAEVDFDGRRADVSSNPMRVWTGSPETLRLFGDTHVHSGSDVERLSTLGGDHRGQFVVSDHAHRYARDVSALDWTVSAEHDTGMSAETFAANARRLAAFAEADRFTVLQGYEWTPSRRIGHHVVVFRDATGNPLVPASSGKKTDRGVPTVVDLAAAIRSSGRRALLIPHMMQPFPNQDPSKNERARPHETWDGPPGTPAGAYVLNDVRRVAEIYSHHNDDFAPATFEQRPEGAENQPQIFELGAGSPWSLQHAWATGHRVGVVAGSDNHLGTPGMNDVSRDVQHHSGLTVVLAAGRSREAIFDALFERRCYATTGAKIWLDFTVNGQPMGSELAAREQVAVSAVVEGTAPLESVEIVMLRGGEFVTAHVARLDGSASATIAATQPISGPTLLYLRVRQADGEMAWSSPVWIV